MAYQAGLVNLPIDSILFYSVLRSIYMLIEL